MNTKVSLDAQAVGSAAAGCTPARRVTRSLLGYGIVAGPFYVLVSLAQAMLRDGFDLTRHDWSLLANGRGGWVQSANLVLSGLMVVAAAVGCARALRSGPGHRPVPWLLAGYGSGLVGAGIFRADPMAGFPTGTPDGPPVSVTGHGMLHLVCAGIGFVALVVAALVLARRFGREGRPGRAAFSVLTGVAFLAGFAGVASGSSAPSVVLGFTAAVLLAWAWLSSTALDLYRRA
jgi:hypothetical membrane protein